MPSRRGVDEHLVRRRAAMPIIDRARLSMLVAVARRGTWSAVWLKYLRPCMLAACWLAATYYIWYEVLAGTDAPPLLRELALYAAGALGILVLMLVMVTRRQRVVARERPSDFHASTLDEVSDLTSLSAQDLEGWRNAQRIVVHHNAGGVPTHMESLPQRRRSPLASSGRQTGNVASGSSSETKKGPPKRA